MHHIRWRNITLTTRFRLIENHLTLIPSPFSLLLPSKKDLAKLLLKFLLLTVYLVKPEILADTDEFENLENR